MNTPFILASSPRPLSIVLAEAVCRGQPRPPERQRPIDSSHGEDQFELLIDGDEERVEAPPQTVVRPDDVAVACLLGRAFEGNREALKKLARSDSVAIIDVPGTEYIEPVIRILRQHVFAGGTRVIDGDSLQLSEKSIATSGSIVAFSRDGSSKGKMAAAGNAEFAIAIQRHFAVIGIAADPERALPRDLVRIAGHRFVVPPLDVETIAVVIEAITGRRPATIDNALTERATLHDLVVSVRSDLGPTRSLARLQRLVATNDTDTTPRLEDMHGLGEAKTWGLNLVRDLQDYLSKRIPWSAVDKGCLLIGPPGTGKTTFARSLKKSAGPRVHFVATSYSQWQSYKEGHLGNVTTAIRASFEEAAKNQPCILFIDEIDTIPPRNSGANSGSSTGARDDWWAAVLTVLLECMDGVEKREGVVVIGACNHPRLDPALTRAGRLDKQVRISLPDTPALAGILRTHLGKELAGVDLLPAAAAAGGGTGADVERWVRVARRAARAAERPLALDDLMAAIRDGRTELPSDVRRRVAYHEAGHAIASVVLGLARPVSLSIHVSGGLTEAQSIRSPSQTRALLESYLVCGLAGRAAELLVFGDVTAGAGGDVESDLSRATRLALQMETSFGLGALGPIWLNDEPVARDLLIFPDLRQSVAATLETAGLRAKQLLNDNRAALNRLAEALFARGFLDGADIERVLGAPPPNSTPATRQAPASTEEAPPDLVSSETANVADVPTLDSPDLQDADHV